VCSVWAGGGGCVSRGARAVSVQVSAWGGGGEGEGSGDVRGGGVGGPDIENRISC